MERNQALVATVKKKKKRGKVRKNFEFTPKKRKKSGKVLKNSSFHQHDLIFVASKPWKYVTRKGVTRYEKIQPWMGNEGEVVDLTGGILQLAIWLVVYLPL